MATELERRIEALEAQSRGAGPLAELSDVELMRRILRLHFERDPSADELHEWMTLPPHEAERRNREMLAAVRRQLQTPTNQSEARHAHA